MLEEILADFTTKTSLPPAVIFARLIGASIIVAGIGFERELQNRAAGLRTHMLVSLAAAMFSIISIEVVANPHLADAQVRLDPLRVIEAVTAGVAFLAAGFIIFARGEVRNVTTGAGIWLAGAIGLSAGFGYWLIAVAAGVIGLVIMFVLRLVEKAASLKE